MNISHTEFFALTHPPFDLDEEGLMPTPKDTSVKIAHLMKTGEKNGFPVLTKCGPDQSTHLSIVVHARMRCAGKSWTMKKKWQVLFHNLRSRTGNTPPSWEPSIIRVLNANDKPWN